MFVRTLGTVWAQRTFSDALLEAITPLDDDAAEWLRGLKAASERDAAVLVMAATAERTTAATRWLLTCARTALSGDLPVDWREIGNLGTLLLRVVKEGHGSDFPDSRLARAHARMLIALGSHLFDLTLAGSSYGQAAGEYRRYGHSLSSALAEIGAVTVERRVFLEGSTTLSTPGWPPSP